MAKKILIVTTSHDKLGSTDQPTGSWVEEVASPYLLWKEHGYDVTIASIKVQSLSELAASAPPLHCLAVLRHLAYSLPSLTCYNFEIFVF
jgi:putative intracellular protease/amidase